MKKTIHGTDGRTKQMLVQIERLSKELSAQRKHVAGDWKPQPPSRDDKDTRELLVDLRNQVQSLNSQNSGLKGKVQFFKTLHEAEARKRTPYTHIPPRVESGAKRVTKNSRLGIHEYQESNNNETILELQELVNHLRTKLCESESHNSNNRDPDAATSTSNALADRDEMRKQYDIDLMSLQHENNNLKKRIVEQRKHNDELQESQTSLTQMYKEILETTKVLGNDLQTERSNSMALMNSLRQEQTKNEARGEIDVIIDDLQKEKKLLEEELLKMTNNKFSTSRDEEFMLQISTLKARIVELQNNNSSNLQDKLDLHKALEELKAEYRDFDSYKRINDAERYELQNELEALKRRFKIYDNLSASDLEEAFELLRLKRDSGVTVEFLENIGNIKDDQNRIHELRKQYASCCQDLDKTTQLLKLQESINAGYKTELVQLKHRAKILQNEYEFRLEEYSRLADVRGHRIDILEREMREMSVIPRTSSTKTKILAPKNVLQPGQNVISIQTQAAIISPAGCESLWKRYGTPIDSNYTTCPSIDFYNFETVVMGLSFGTKPTYDTTTRFNVCVDDYFMTYIQNNPAVFSIYHLNGMEFTKIGHVHANFSEIILGNERAYKYIGDILTNEQFVIGKLEYTISVEISMPLAVRAFNERISALNLNKHANTLVGTTKPKAQGKLNNLQIRIKSAVYKNEDIMKKLVFGSIHWPALQRIVLISPAKPASTLLFDYHTIVPLHMTGDLDRQLRTGKILVAFADDSTGAGYGYVKIATGPLALGNTIIGDIEIQENNGKICGMCNVEIFWESLYTLEEINVF